MARSLNFSVDSKRIGTQSTVRVFFPDREASLNYIASLRKAHFMGELTPMQWQDGAWELDMEGLRAMSMPAVLERQNLFGQAATFFKALSKSDDDMSPEQVSDLLDLMTSIAVVVSEATNTHVFLERRSDDGDEDYEPVQVQERIGTDTYEEVQRYS